MLFFAVFILILWRFYDIIEESRGNKNFNKLILEVIMSGRIEYMCSYCGAKITMPRNGGRPQPGYCPRKPRTKDGKMKPHSWRVNRKID